MTRDGEVVWIGKRLQNLTGRGLDAPKGVSV
jgi:hypothetical protein